VDIQGKMTGCDFLNLGDGMNYLLTLAEERASIRCDFCNGEMLVRIFCRLGNTVKDYVVISLSCTKESIHWAKRRFLVV
jgi:hypothetical protein